MPRPSLRGAFASPGAKRRYVRRLFATIAGRYDLITRVLSFGRDRRWKVRLVDLAGIRPGGRVLDLACGTGDLAVEAERRGGRVVGLDITPGMIARARSRRETDGCIWIVADMADLPLAPAVFDCVTTGYGLRNAPDLDRALAEARRVLKPGGSFCALDFERPEAAWLRAVYFAYLTVVGAALGWLLHRDPDTYRYIPASIRRYPGARAVADRLRRTGFTDVRHVRVFGGLMAIHVARR